MGQTILAIIDEDEMELILPDPDEVVLGDIKWGRSECLCTPSYWATQCWLRSKGYLPHRFRVGETLAEEIAVCLLAGHGVRAEIGVAAYDALKKRGVLQPDKTISHSDIEDILSEPLCIGNRKIRYRFYKRKSYYIAEAMRYLANYTLDTNDHIKFRNALMDIAGVGYKTASFVTRNWLDSDCVAILDIHVLRAGRLLGIYENNDKPERNYEYMEYRFLDFAKAINVRPSWLDAIMWEDMRIIPSALTYKTN